MPSDPHGRGYQYMFASYGHSVSVRTCVHACVCVSASVRACAFPVEMYLPSPIQPPAVLCTPFSRISCVRACVRACVSCRNINNWKSSHLLCFFEAGQLPPPSILYPPMMWSLLLCVVIILLRAFNCKNGVLFLLVPCCTGVRVR